MSKEITHEELDLEYLKNVLKEIRQAYTLKRDPKLDKYFQYLSPKFVRIDIGELQQNRGEFVACFRFRERGQGWGQIYVLTIKPASGNTENIDQMVIHKTGPSEISDGGYIKLPTDIYNLKPEDLLDAIRQIEVAELFDAF